MMNRISVVLLLMLFNIGVLAGNPMTADTVYTNGKVYTVDKDQPWSESFAVKGNKIIAVGKTDELKRFVGKSTKLVDLQNRLVLPGLVEEHVHPDMAAEMFMNISLQPSQMSWQQQAKVITDFARQDKGKGWIIGGALG